MRIDIRDNVNIESFYMNMEEPDNESNNQEEEEILSPCCGAEIICSDLCSECLEHCI
jgi:hypothetical protein